MTFLVSILQCVVAWVVHIQSLEAMLDLHHSANTPVASWIQGIDIDDVLMPIYHHVKRELDRDVILYDLPR